MMNITIILAYLFHHGCKASPFICLKVHRFEEDDSLTLAPVILTEGLIWCPSIHLC